MELVLGSNLVLNGDCLLQGRTDQLYPTTTEAEVLKPPNTAHSKCKTLGAQPHSPLSQACRSNLAGMEAQIRTAPSYSRYVVISIRYHHTGVSTELVLTNGVEYCTSFPFPA